MHKLSCQIAIVFAEVLHCFSKRQQYSEVQVEQYLLISKVLIFNLLQSVLLRDIVIIKIYLQIVLKATILTQKECPRCSNLGM